MQQPVHQHSVHGLGILPRVAGYWDGRAAVLKIGARLPVRRKPKKEVGENWRQRQEIEEQ